MTDPLQTFDLDDPVLPGAIKKTAPAWGGYRYAKKLERERYTAELGHLPRQLALLQSHILKGRGS